MVKSYQVVIEGVDLWRFLPTFFQNPIPAMRSNPSSACSTSYTALAGRMIFFPSGPERAFNRECRNIRAREIGQRLDEIGGLALMEYANRQVRKKLGKNLSWHLEAAWKDIGKWIA